MPQRQHRLLQFGIIPRRIDVGGSTVAQRSCTGERDEVFGGFVIGPAVE